MKISRAAWLRALISSSFSVTSFPGLFDLTPNNRVIMLSISRVVVVLVFFSSFIKVII